jgi:hypothetical protein
MSTDSADKNSIDSPPTAEPPPNETVQAPDTDLEKRTTVYDALLSKYIAVWLWSIIFGAVSGIFYSFISYRSYGERVGPLILFASLTTILGIASAVVAFFSLYQGLVKYLIPRFFLNEKPSAEILARALKNAFLMLIISLIIRLAQSLFEIILTSLTF